MRVLTHPSAHSAAPIAAREAVVALLSGELSQEEQVEIAAQMVITLSAAIEQATEYQEDPSTGLVHVTNLFSPGVLGIGATPAAALADFQSRVTADIARFAGAEETTNWMEL